MTIQRAKATAQAIKRNCSQRLQRKKESENFIIECNKLMSIKAQNDDQNFMAKSFILSNNDLIEWSLKYCNIKTKDEYENMKEKFILL